MPRHVPHRQRRGLGFPAESDGLDLDEVRVPQRHEACIVRGVGHVVVLDQREPVGGPLVLLRERTQRVEVPLPEVREDRPIDGFQRLFCACVNADVQLRHRHEVFDGLWELSIRHQKGANLPAVELHDEVVDSRVHDRLADQRQGAMTHVHRRLPTLLLDTGDALALPDHALVRLDAFGDDGVGLVHLPLPLRARGVLVVAPAENALVRASEGRRGLHALVGGDAVERVFVAPAAAAQLVLRPPAQLDRRVRPDDLVALLRQLLPMPLRHHFSRGRLQRGAHGAGARLR
mmetsp:Transcript_32933/g.93631  ORF Transcript_32933/g.93631 Transcript_32933/m.93631 type:complete len:289 (+) Transcript_32933:455-1321(+)